MEMTYINFALFAQKSRSAENAPQRRCLRKTIMSYKCSKSNLRCLRKNCAARKLRRSAAVCAR